MTILYTSFLYNMNQEVHNNALILSRLYYYLANNNKDHLIHIYPHFKIEIERKEKKSNLYYIIYFTYSQSSSSQSSSGSASFCIVIPARRSSKAFAIIFNTLPSSASETVCFSESS